jgi:hypothetical protein
MPSHQGGKGILVAPSHELFQQVLVGKAASNPQAGNPADVTDDRIALRG